MIKLISDHISSINYNKEGKNLCDTSQCEWSSITLYTNTDPLVVLAGRAKKQPSKLGENAQSPKYKKKIYRSKKSNITLVAYPIYNPINQSL